MEGKRIAPYLGLSIKEKIENPLIFQYVSVVSGTTNKRIHGFDVTLKHGNPHIFSN
jgi:hypothetical protein